MRGSVQRYMCTDCHRQFCGKTKVPAIELWMEYMDGKQTIAQLSQNHGISESTIKRRLHTYEATWKNPDLQGRHGVINIDATYFGRNYGVMVALDYTSGQVIYMKIISHERVVDYTEAISTIEHAGYFIDGIVIDGIHRLFDVFHAYKIQMCQYHMCAIIRRKLTQNPKLEAGIELSHIMHTLAQSDEYSFVTSFQAWKAKWELFLKEKTRNQETGGWAYTHRRLRSACQSIEFYLPYLFTYQKVVGMPNTNNKIEGMFTNLKVKLRVHSGMNKKNRERFIQAFFLAWNKSLAT